MATPEEFRVAVPKLAEPLKNVTVPLGVAVPFTEAVKVSSWPSITGLGDAERIVVVV